MSKAKGVFKVYFDTNGDLLHRLYYWMQQQGNFKEEDNHVFQDRLEYTGFSGNHVSFKSLTTGRKYHMFVSDFHHVMMAKVLKDNIIEGDFTFCRKGVVQGFKMILPKKP